MKLIDKSTLIIVFILSVNFAFSQSKAPYQAIYSGIPWVDDKGNIVSAHGANIIKDKGKFYLFGEAHSDTNNAFTGFNCYSSTDLYNWKFESIALPVQKSGRLGENRVGERVKVMKCAKTGEYVMLMHSDSLNYKDPCVAYATSKNITGPYIFHGPLLFNGQQIKKWDMGTFQDDDGSAYLLVHSGNIYKLNSDYKSIAEQVVKDMEPEGESPAMFKKGGVYFWLASHRTSWERNDNFYYTASSIKGPWLARGVFAPEGSLTWNSQTTFVLPIQGSKDTTYMFMGDRWAFPRQASAATYVWQPITVKDSTFSISQFQQAWQINTQTGETNAATIGDYVIENTDFNRIKYSGKWNHVKLADGLSLSESDTKNATFKVNFQGTQIGFYGFSDAFGGYAQVTISNHKNEIVCSVIVDMYAKNPVSTLKYLSPLLKKADYTLTVSVLGDRGNWTDKRKIIYGSKGYFAKLDKIIINK